MVQKLGLVSGAAFNITAELSIPIANGGEYRNAVDLARTITFLIFIFIDPAVTMTVLSNRGFAKIPLLADNEANLIPLEIRQTYFPLYTENGTATVEALEQIKQTWQITHELAKKSAEFALGVEALSTAQFQQNSALILVSLWAALEALFSPSSAELRFRVSSLIAAYLEQPGAKRAALQKDVAKLYDKRSSAAHGVPKHNHDDVVSTMRLLRRVFIAIIEDGKVPTREELEAKLFGAS